MTKRRRGPLTGIHDPAYDGTSEPWQIQNLKRFVGGLRTSSRSSRDAWRVLGLCLLAALACIVLPLLVIALAKFL